MSLQVYHIDVEPVECEVEGHFDKGVTALGEAMDYGYASLVVGLGNVLDFGEEEVHGGVSSCGAGFVVSFEFESLREGEFPFAKGLQ